jgi:hypothetical protein
VFGAAAVSATASVLGFAAEVPDPVKKRGRSVEPSTNGEAK